MDLTRIGSNRRELKFTAFSDKEPSIAFFHKDGMINLTVTNANGMGPRGEYDYTISLSIKDLMAIIEKVAGTQAIFEKGNIQDALKENVNSILRLLMASAALPFQLTEKKK